MLTASLECRCRTDRWRTLRGSEGQTMASSLGVPTAICSPRRHFALGMECQSGLFTSATHSLQSLRRAGSSMRNPETNGQQETSPCSAPDRHLIPRFNYRQVPLVLLGFRGVLDSVVFDHGAAPRHSSLNYADGEKNPKAMVCEKRGFLSLG